jgi:Flp pilus assembly protein TadD
MLLMLLSTFSNEDSIDSPMQWLFSLWLVVIAFSCVLPAWGEDQWLEIASPHFRVVTDGGERRGRETALEFEQMRSVFAQVFLKDRSDGSVPVLIVALKNEKELSEFAPLYKGKPVHTSGLCQTGPDGNTILLDLLAKNTWQVVVHEYGHVMLSGLRNSPAWFNEGFAGYYSSIKIFKKDAIVGHPPDGFADVLNNEKLLPVTTLFGVTQGSPLYNDERNQRSLFYAESWLVVHYLWNSHMQAQMLKYLDLTRHSVPVADAIKQAFKMSPAEFDRAVEKYLREGPKVSHLPLPEPPEKARLAVKLVAQLEAAAILADVHLHEHDYEEQGISEFQKILKEDPGNAAAHRGLGYAYFNHHDLDAAMPHLDQAAEKNPMDWQVHYYQAMLLSQKQDNAAAEKMEREALRVTELNPGFAAGYGLLGFALMSQHKSAQAAAAYEKALSLDPGNEADTLNLAELYSLQGRLVDAKPLFLRLQNSSNETIATAARSHLDLMK